MPCPATMGMRPAKISFTAESLRYAPAAAVRNRGKEVVRRCLPRLEFAELAAPEQQGRHFAPVQVQQLRDEDLVVSTIVNALHLRRESRRTASHHRHPLLPVDTGDQVG